MTDKQLVAGGLELARIFYSSLGYRVNKGYKFYESSHPQEIEMWRMAVAAYDHIEGSCLESALANVID